MAKSNTKKAKKNKTKSALPPIKCKGCGIQFVPADRRQHFHTSKCRESYYERTYYTGVSKRKKCPECGNTFTTTKPARQVYCSEECRISHQHKSRDSIQASVNAERETFLGDRFSTLQSYNFRCAYCGKSAHDGVMLDVEQDNEHGGFRTICNECVQGREFNTRR